MICLILFCLLVFVGLRFNFLDCYNKFFSSTQINANANGLQGNINGNAQPIPQFDNIKKNIQQNIDNNCYYNSSQSCVPSSNVLKKAQIFTTAQNQPQAQKINGKQNEKYQNIFYKR